MAGSSVLPKLDDEDKMTIVRLRKDLAGWRIVSGMTQLEVSQQIGSSDDMISKIERGAEGALRLSSIARIAAVYGLQVSIRYEGLEELLEESSPELESMFNLVDADPYNGMWLSMLCVAALRHMRKKLKISGVDMAKKLGIKDNSLSDWELSSSDPNLCRMLAYATHLGGRMRVTLLEVNPVVS